MLQLYRGVLIPQIFESACPVEFELPSRLLLPFPNQRCYKRFDFLADLRRQPLDQLLKGFRMVFHRSTLCFKITTASSRPPYSCITIFFFGPMMRIPCLRHHSYFRLFTFTF